MVPLITFYISKLVEYREWGNLYINRLKVCLFD